MDDLVRRIAFEIQEDRMGRLKAQRLVVAVLAALNDGDQIGKTLIVRLNGRHDEWRDGPRFCSWD